MLHSPAIATILLVLTAHADTAAPTSPLDAWTEPPADGALAGEPQGLATLSPSSFQAQTKVTVDYLYIVGADGMDVGDGIRVEDPILHGMRWSKYGASVLDPGGCTPLADDYRGVSYGLVTAWGSGAATLGLSRNTVDAELHSYGYTDVWLEDGRLGAGDQIRVRFGDTSQSSVCGHQVPDRAFSDVPWRCFENIAGDFTQLEPSPTFDIEPLPEVALVWVAAPSVVVLGETPSLTVAVLDRLGNPVPDSGLELVVDDAYGGATASLGADNPGWAKLELVLEHEGTHRVRVTGGTLEATSNPILVVEQQPERRLYWGDLHAHHGHTRQLDDGTRVDENHVYARDVLGWDLGCESMKLPPREIDGRSLWTDLQRACSADTTDGSYVAMLGFEWMGQTRSDGHHNVYFEDCDGFLSDHEDIPGLQDEGGLLDTVSQVEAAGGARAVVVSHASAYTGFNWNVHDDEHRTVAEVYSGWGNSLEANDRGSVERALALGHRLGFIASSDNHDGWLGNPRSRLGRPAGITAFWAPALTRGDIFEALRDRGTYATTGARIIVDFHAIVRDEHIHAGNKVIPDQVRLGWEVHGTDTIQSISVRGVAPGTQSSIQVLHQEEPGVLDAEGSYEQTGWRGRSWAFWLRVEQTDGQVAWSSPLWVTNSCDQPDTLDPTGVCDPRDTGRERADGCGCAHGARPAQAWWSLFLLVGLRRRESGRVNPPFPASDPRRTWRRRPPAGGMLPTG